MSQIEAKFTLGQRVKAISFTDCFGNFIPERKGLIVTTVRLFEWPSMRPYYRIVASEPNEDRGYVEGAERFFEAEA